MAAVGVLISARDASAHTSDLGRILKSTVTVTASPFVLLPMSCLSLNSVAQLWGLWVFLAPFMPPSLLGSHISSPYLWDTLQNSLSTYVLGLFTFIFPLIMCSRLKKCRSHFTGEKKAAKYTCCSSSDFLKYVVMHGEARFLLTCLEVSHSCLPFLPFTHCSVFTHFSIWWLFSL